MNSLISFNKIMLAYASIEGISRWLDKHRRIWLPTFSSSQVNNVDRRRFRSTYVRRSTRFLILIFSLFFLSGPCARLSWPSRQLLSARKSTVSYRIVSYLYIKFDNSSFSRSRDMAGAHQKWFTWPDHAPSRNKRGVAYLLQVVMVTHGHTHSHWK